MTVGHGTSQHSFSLHNTNVQFVSHSAVSLELNTCMYFIIIFVQRKFRISVVFCL